MLPKPSFSCKRAVSSGTQCFSSTIKAYRYLPWGSSIPASHRFWILWRQLEPVFQLLKSPATQTERASPLKTKMIRAFPAETDWGPGDVGVEAEGMTHPPNHRSIRQKLHPSMTLPNKNKKDRDFSMAAHGNTEAMEGSRRRMRTSPPPQYFQESFMTIVSGIWKPCVINQKICSERFRV
jgi:hypothetical protein